ncbi:hypothetical protein ACP4OV_031731 [Aristida adscensionis]
MQQQQQEDETAHTVSAAAVVLAAAARSTTGLLLHHHQHLHDNLDCTATKKRWWSRLKAKLCFRPHGHPQRIADAVPPSPEPAAAGEQQPAASSSSYYARHAPQPALAFVAPPSSPASSVLTSEAASPAVLLHASSYSSPTASMFAVGPYAREPQQPVSPPAFSAGLTEPSTAPLTPPPESAAGLHLGTTTPSSPEVPFARFLSSSAAAQQQGGGGGGGTEAGFFQAYQLQPGSPILVSPGSTSSSPPAWVFGVAEERKAHRARARNEGSLLDGRIPEAASAGAGEDGGGSARNGSEEAGGRSGEFVFGNADAAGGDHGHGGGGAALSMGTGDAASSSSPSPPTTEGGKQKQWPFFIHQA